jgi:hypothetical protein
MSKAIDLKAKMKAGIGGLRATGKPGLFEPTAPVEADPFPVLEVLEVLEEPKAPRSYSGAFVHEKSEKEVCDQRVTVPMTLDHRETLERIERLCRANKQAKPERITSNTVARTLFELVSGIDEDFSDVVTKKDLKEVLLRYIFRQGMT